MKTQTKEITIASVQHSPVIERIIEKNDAALKMLAEKNAKHYAKHNRPHPENDTLPPFTGELKTGYEKTNAELLHYLMPKLHLPQGKMDIDFSAEKARKYEKDIKDLEDKNHHDEYALSGYNPGTIKPRLWLMGILSVFITFGEIVFNINAFQVIGENMIKALLISIMASLGVFVFSHHTAFSIKNAETIIKKRLIILRSLAIVTVVFIALGFMRSAYLASHDVHVSPVYFVIINVFLFGVSVCLSYYLLPTFNELKEHLEHLRLHNKIEKRKEKILKLKHELQELKTAVNESSKVRVQLMYYANYLNTRLEKLYMEKVEIFKGKNLIYRTDGKTPRCFHEIPPKLDIEYVTLFYNRSNPSKQ